MFHLKEKKSLAFNQKLPGIPSGQKAKETDHRRMGCWSQQTQTLKYCSQQRTRWIISPENCNLFLKCN